MPQAPGKQAKQAQVLHAASTTSERTPLSREEEAAFQQWAADNRIQDVDHPDSHYDMRGYWKDVVLKGQDQTEINAQDGKRHYPDTYKQHGHPTFSTQSKYSKGYWDGGTWIGNNDTYLKQEPMAPSHRAGS